MRIMLMLFVILVLVLTGCATSGNYEAVKKEIINRVDPISIKNQPQFWTDVVFCTELGAAEADRFAREVMNRAVLGALLGAATGAAYGSAFGKQYTGFGAQVGATSGAIHGMNSAQSRYYSITTNCLLNRGYLLLW